ncbi:hypothetical protein [Novosphingobium sp.]|uniref:hypothetical protein n=1 Tax=Novosphingobium sp. TaxID=1874826 RepID=UPI003BAC0BD2
MEMHMRLLISTIALLLFANPTRADEKQSLTVMPDRTAALALINSISQQIKPFWLAPSGPEGDKLVTTLRWDINGAGEVVGQPQVVSVEGVTEKNRKLIKRHIANAIKAVLSAAPFHPPPEYRHILMWRGITVRFDRKIPIEKERSVDDPIGS